MKTNKLKALLVSGMVSASIVMSAFAFQGAFRSYPVGTNFPADQKIIQSDIVKIKSDRQSRKILREQLNADRRNHPLTMAVIQDKKALRHNKADLKRDLAYWRADKKDLKEDYSLILRESKKTVKLDRQLVRADKKQVRCDMRKDDDVALISDATKLSQHTNQLNKHFDTYAEIKSNRDADFVAINDHYKQVKSESRSVFASWFMSSENSVASK